MLVPRFVSTEAFPADSAYIGLAAPGEKGSWQSESKVTWVVHCPQFSVFRGEFDAMPVINRLIIFIT